MTLPNTDLFARAFFVADHAAVENGKVYASGAFWNRLRFPSFPAVLTFSVVIILEIPWRAHHEEHMLSVSFEDADAKPLQPGFEGGFVVGSPPEAKRGDPTIMPIAATVGNLTIPGAGDYAAVLKVAGAELDRWPFRASQVLTPDTPTSPPHHGPQSTGPES